MINVGDNVVLYTIDSKDVPTIIGQTTVTKVEKYGFSSGGNDYQIYFDNGKVAITSDWHWHIRYDNDDNQDVYGFIGTPEEFDTLNKKKKSYISLIDSIYTLSETVHKSYFFDNHTVQEIDLLNTLVSTLTNDINHNEQHSLDEMLKNEINKKNKVIKEFANFVKSIEKNQNDLIAILDTYKNYIIDTKK